MKCLSQGALLPQEVYSLLPYIENFVKEASLCKSVDGYLTMLDTLLYSIEDYYGRGRARSIVEKIFECDEIRNALRPLINYIDKVEQLALSDPRHNTTRRYLDLIIETLKSQEPVEKSLEVIRPRIGELLEAPTGYTYSAYSTIIEPVETQHGRRGIYKSGRRRSVKRTAVLALGLITLIALVLIVLFNFNLFNITLINNNALNNTGVSTSPTREPSHIFPPYPQYTLDYKVTSSLVLIDIRSEVYGSHIPQTKVDAILWLMDWASRNLEYGRADGRKVNLTVTELPLITINYPALAPEEVLRLKRGTCIDLSLFYATALLSVNVTPVYVVVFENENHAVVGVEVDGVLYIIEATNPSIPPSEFADYLEYIEGYKAGSHRSIRIFELSVSGRDVIYIPLNYLGTTLFTPEKYVNDTLPPTINRDIAEAIAKESGLLVTESAKDAWMLKISIPPSTPFNSSHPITRLYTPVFKEWWVKYYARLVLDVVGADRYKYKYIWVEVSGDDIVVYFS